MDWCNIEYQIKKYTVNYFDLTTKAARKEFNLSMLIYSVVLISLLYIILDLDSINDLLFHQMGSMQTDVLEGKATQQEVADATMNQVASLIPETFLNIFALLLLPLYIRRLNDTFFHTIAFAFPIVTVYAFDAISSIFSFHATFGLYNAMSLFTTIMTAVICICPSKVEYNDD